MPHGMGTGNNNGYTPLEIDWGIKPQPTIGQQRSGSRGNSGSSRSGRQESTAERIKRRAAVGLSNHRQGGGNQNRSGVKPIDGSYRKAVEAGKDGKVTYGTLPPNAGPIAEETVINENGVVQTGKNLGGGGTPIDMSRGFDSMLAEMGLGQYSNNPKFSSNQLPTTEGSPDAKITPKANQVLAGIQAGKETDMSIDGYNAPGYKTIQPTDPIHAEAFGQDLTDQRIAAGNSKETGYTKGGRLDQALAGVKTQEASREMTPERRQAMASMAFYNADGGLEGLRARDAANEVIYAGGQHWGRGALTEDSKYGDKYKIDRADARDIASGKTTAAGLLQTYKDRITASNSDKVPAAEQAPATIEKPDVKQDFGRTETVSTPINTDIDGSIEFNVNNDNPVPDFDTKEMWETISKKPAADYSTIFTYK